MKIMTIIGTRPEAIKLCPVINELRRRAAASGGKIFAPVAITAQHRGLLDQMLAVFGVRPDFDLDLMQANQSLASTGAGVMTGLEKVFSSEKPDWVIVQGDTTTAAMATITACFSRIKVAHVEAGLRTGDKWCPFPEELNRRLTGVAAELHFAPTPKSRENLIRENISADRIVVSGNTVIDALSWAVRQGPGDRIRALLEECGRESRIILVTAHRRENFGERLVEICRGLRSLALEFGGDVEIVYPVHPNPNVRATVGRHLADVPHVHLIEPLDYLDFVQMMHVSHFLITDSGGIQEEAPALGKPVLVLRDATERPEAVDIGVVKIIGTDSHRIFAESELLLTNPGEYVRMSRGGSPYGDGFASGRIVAALLGQKYDEFRYQAGESCLVPASTVLV